MDDGTSRAGRRNAFGVIAGALFVIGPALAWLGVVRGLVAFVLFALGGLTGVVVGVTSVIQAARGRGLGSGGAAREFLDFSQAGEQPLAGLGLLRALQNRIDQQAAQRVACRRMIAT